MKRLMKKLCVLFLPIASLLSLASCSSQVTVTLDAGAGMFTNYMPAISLTVSKGTQFQNLRFDQPISYMSESIGGDYIYPYAWYNPQDKMINPDYAIKNNITLTAHYFASQEDAINYGRDIVSRDAAATIAEAGSYRMECIAAYDQIIDKLIQATNESQVYAIALASRGDLGGLKRAIINNKHDALDDTMFAWRERTCNMCLSSQGKGGLALGKIFAALYDAAFECYTDEIKDTFEPWFDFFLNKLNDTVVNHDASNVYVGVGTFNQAYVGSVKRCFMNNRSDVVDPTKSLCSLYNDAFTKCHHPYQAISMGKGGSAICDAALENYQSKPESFKDYYALAEKQINELLHKFGEGQL